MTRGYLPVAVMSVGFRALGFTRVPVPFLAPMSPMVMEASPTAKESSLAAEPLPPARWKVKPFASLVKEKPGCVLGLMAVFMGRKEPSSS